MKQTILFSNVLGDISSKNEDCSFNQNLINAIQNSNCNDKNLVFINAPGFENDDLYFNKILNCFKKIDFHFDKTIELSNMSKIQELADFPKNRIYFLMGGNPLTQYELIKNYGLLDELKNYDGLVIGFCAGAINLSKHSIITTDNDFDTPLSYNGINRINISIEPHFYLDDSSFTKNRLLEIKNFCKSLNTNIYAIPDMSVIHVIDEKIEFLGKVYKY